MRHYTHPTFRQVRKSQSFTISLRHALRGWRQAAFYEANIRRQLLVIIITAGIAALVRVAVLEAILLIIVAAFVFTTEMMNSALESLADAVEPSYNEYVERAKNIAAGAVLVASLTALVIGVAILAPPLLQLIEKMRA